MDKNFLEIEKLKMREKIDGYEIFEAKIIDNFNLLVKDETPLFIADVDNLWEIYLNNLPEEARQYYNCNGCKYFIDRFGALVTITEKGKMKSVIWSDDMPEFFSKSVEKMNDAILNSKIKKVFVSDERVLGIPKTGVWTHISASLPISKVNKSRLLTAGQIMAEKSEDYRMLSRALEEYSKTTIDSAVELLQSETLYRTDKCLGVGEWFKELSDKTSNAPNSKIKNNLKWLAVATAPTGFCHIKSSMIGTLLDDIECGMRFETVARRFKDKMDPTKYMRSQSAPTQQAILDAEKMVEKLGIADALSRRYATLEEIPEFIWKNTYKDKIENKSTGIFANVKPKQPTNTLSPEMNLPSTTMTWEKFKRTVLPTAKNIEVKVDNPNRLMALVTSSIEKSENILQWDNPFSWYYHGGIDGEIKRRVENAGGKYENNEIRCSLIWEGFTDLDLRCITPAGQKIYYGNRKDLTGGWLDIDMNGGSHRDASPVENIRWANRAREGRYAFYVNNYQERGNGTTPYTVELEVNGKIYTYHGIASSTGYDLKVFEFNYVKGEQPQNVGMPNVSISSNNTWNIDNNSFVKVTGITTSPNLWGENNAKHSGSHIFFLLEDCKDMSEGKGRGFFNEMLKPELREIRKTLEAYMADAPIENLENASACGVGMSKDSEWNLILKVTSNNTTRLIKIDRWD